MRTVPLPVSAAAILVAALLVAACGQKGPLYLPDRNATVVTRPSGSSSPGTPPEQAPGTTLPQQTSPAAPPAPPPPRPRQGASEETDAPGTPRS